MSQNSCCSEPKPASRHALFRPQGKISGDFTHMCNISAFLNNLYCLLFCLCGQCPREQFEKERFILPVLETSVHGWLTQAIGQNITEALFRLTINKGLRGGQDCRSRSSARPLAGHFPKSPSLLLTVPPAGYQADHSNLFGFAIQTIPEQAEVGAYRKTSQRLGLHNPSGAEVEVGIPQF